MDECKLCGERDTLYATCRRCNMQTLILPSIYQHADHIREFMELTRANYLKTNRRRKKI